jgi:hypothetical protein
MGIACELFDVGFPGVWLRVLGFSVFTSVVVAFPGEWVRGLVSFSVFRGIAQETCCSGDMVRVYILAYLRSM